jgi:hypothetical protein
MICISHKPERVVGMLNYKNQLRAMVETSTRRPTVQQEEEENEDDVASPEASILSSAEVTRDQLASMDQSTEFSYCNIASPNRDGRSSLSTTSSQYHFDDDNKRSLSISRNRMQEEASFSTTSSTNGNMPNVVSSFLSVSPSMVDSSMLFDSPEEKDPSVISSMSDDSAIIRSRSAEDEDLEEEPRWYDRSTFESVGEQMMVDSHGDEPQVDQDVPPKTQGDNTTTKEATAMGAALQAGTIVLGAVSILLMLAFGGGSRDDREKANKAKTSDDDKSKRKLTRECKQSSMTTDRYMPWLLQDW